VTITETRGSDAHVSVEGYSSAGSNAVVSAIGQRIVLVNLTAPDQAQRQAGAQTKDSYGTVWTQVTVSGWVAAGALTQDVQSVWTRAGQVYASHCSTCHSLYAPDQYTANQWPGNLQNMASNGGLSGEDFALVLKYLQTHAKPQ
jgi:nitrate/TMAO reductase-like tetraheme cytochrome c subunit